MKIGVAQLNLADSVGENTQKILGFVERGIHEGLACLAFPETALSGYVYDGFLTLDYAAVVSALDRIGKRVRGTGLHAVVGTPFEESGVRYNSAAVIYPDGRRLVYHKNLLVSYEEKYFKAGTKRLAFEAGGQRFGVMICRDQNSPELARELGGMGARGIFILSAHYYGLIESHMKREKNRALPVARAYENNVYVFKANAVGSIQGKVSYGGSMLIDPRGVTIQGADDRNEELLVCDIDFGKENPRW
jgi:predicted amidohydrolase